MSISRNKSGLRRILFTNGDGERKTIHVGRMPKKAAEDVDLHVRRINGSMMAGTSIEAADAAWLADLPETLHARLVAVGIAQPRAAASVVTLGALLAGFFAAVAVKPASLVRMRQAEATLVSRFGAGRDVATITEADAEQWRAELKTDDYAAATISRTVLYARQFFRWGIKRGLAKSNPFAGVKAGSQVNHARTHFIDRDTIAKAIDAAPNDEWRLLIALSRFGGLRVPSEALALKWTDVDWEHNRMCVRSPKTEHHEGKAERMVPLFPEVAEPLLALFERPAAERAEYVITSYRDGANLNPQLRRIIKRAGLTPWPRTWHNLRASRQTELAASYPLHTVCGWIGNTKAIAAGHYLQITDADWKRAIASPDAEAPAAPESPATTDAAGDDAQSDARGAQNQAQQAAASSRTISPEWSESACFEGDLHDAASDGETSQNDPMGRAGLEPATLAFSVPCSTN